MYTMRKLGNEKEKLDEYFLFKLKNKSNQKNHHCPLTQE